MKKSLATALCLLFMTSTVLGQNGHYVGEAKRKRHLWVLIPASIVAVGCWYVAKNPPVYHYSDRSLLRVCSNGSMLAGRIPSHKDYFPAVLLGVVAAFLTLGAITPVAVRIKF